jgi:hypothetical protein
LSTARPAVGRCLRGIKGVNPCLQRAPAKGLGEVIIRTQIQPGHHALFIVARSDDDDRDIGLAARLAMETPDLGYEVFYVLSSPEAEKCYDVAYTRTRLGWKAQHDFMWLPPAKDLPK